MGVLRGISPTAVIPGSNPGGRIIIGINLSTFLHAQNDSVLKFSWKKSLKAKLYHSQNFLTYFNFGFYSTRLSEKQC